METVGYTEGSVATQRDDESPIDAEIVEAGDAEVRSVSEPPVVARLVVEIRSDGTRTIARGAIEDVQSGQQVGIEAKGDSPISLAMALARSMFRAPALARTTVRALLPGRRGWRRRR
jgi:hypothetical protein